ncbi:putative beta (1-3) glucanosyltransferase [Coleophoma cylindrospora]|uniref:1,3-beta-glucanosyltransferase n=1 Tax=Coleophoma cylindrospora TaxID=1849047 RepID=A0A3D8RMA3_9HELO|nr:putative beta (1-3) glucanosyltransferase [Coleophoma cylindrospora]
MFRNAALRAGALLGLCSVAAAVTSLTIEGSNFVNPTTGDRFQIVGVAYQPGGSSGYDPSSGVDPLSNGAVCLRDAALMQRLGVNAIRVYNVSPDLNHDECASIFNEAGIYMLLDVNSPLVGESIDRSAPWTTYTTAYLNRTFGVVEAFKNYPNTLLFFAGNEVINDVATGADVPPYMRAVTRDLKNYIAKNSNRSIPVGYSAADVRSILVDTWAYMQCTTTGDSTDPSRVDLFALNSYSWCGDSSYTTSTYNQLVADFSDTSVPVFFSEYGCNDPYPRIFTEVPVIYGPLMSPVLSGGLVYEFSQEASNYGLVNISSDGSAQIRSDYTTLQAQFNTLNSTALQGVKATNTSVVPPTCTSTLITESGFAHNFTLPAVPSGAQSLIDNGIANPNSGKIVTISSTSVTQTVTNVDGTVMTGLKVTPLANDQSNTPSGANDTNSGSTASGTASGTASATGSSASSTATKKSGAGRVQASVCWLGVLGVMAVGGALL